MITFMKRSKQYNEESQFMLLLDLLEGSNIAASGEDERVWTVSKDGSFSVSSSLTIIFLPENSAKNIIVKKEKVSF